MANGVFLLYSCLLRKNNIVVDDQDLTSTELTFMFHLLYPLRNTLSRCKRICDSEQSLLHTYIFNDKYQTQCKKK